MLKIYDCKMTAGAVRKVEEKAGKEVNKLLKDELMKLLSEMKEEEEIEADADLNYIWLDEECKGICSLPDKNFFGQVEELGVYVSIWEQDGEYLTYNDYSDFRDIYLGGDYSFASEEKMEVFAERFQNNLKDIIWDDEDNELKRAVDEELNQIANDEEGEDTIEFIGNKFTTVMDEIAEYVEFKNDEYEVKGYYSGEKIYRIKNKLYYLTDDSWNCNTEYHWYLQELGPRGYEHFQMEKPNGDEVKIEKNYDVILSLNLNEVIFNIYEENEYSTIGTQFIFENDSDEELYKEFVEKFKEERQDIWIKIHENIGLDEIYDSNEVIDNFGDLVTFYKINISGYLDGEYASAVKTYASMKKVTTIDDFGVIKTYVHVEAF